MNKVKFKKQPSSEVSVSDGYSFSNVFPLEPPLVHIPQELGGDGEAGCIANHGVDVAVGTKGG